MSPRQIRCSVAWVATTDAEVAHRTLKANGWLRNDAHPVTKGDQVGFPLTHRPTNERLQEAVGDTFPTPSLKEMELNLSPPTVPHALMVQTTTDWLKEHSLEVNPLLLELLPKKWERLGGLVLLPHGTFSQLEWEEVKNHAHVLTLYQRIAEALGGDSLALQRPIANDRFRSSQIEQLVGTTRVRFQEHHILHSFDAGRVMWSSGNVTERRRIGQLDLRGETVVDAYAGVGYYTLQMLVHGGAAHVHACEWNPASIDGLRTSAALNGVEDRLTVHEGDNSMAMAKLRGVADRVILGLLPSSEPAWKAAVHCLKDSGGWLHVHMNVEEEQLEAWTAATVEQLNSTADAMGRPWALVAKHLEKVKWYAPRVRHVVLDIQAV